MIHQHCLPLPSLFYLYQILYRALLGPNRWRILKQAECISLISPVCLNRQCIMPDIHCLFEQAECISLIHPACLNKQCVSAWYTLPTSRVYQPDTPCLQAECISLIHSVCLNMQYMFENKDYLLAESTWALVNNSLIWQKITWRRPLNCQYGTWQSTVSLVLWHLWGPLSPLRSVR